MSKLNDYIIDYNLVRTFDLESLKINKILPLKKYDFYTLIAISEQSDITYLNSNYQTPIKTIKVNENDILFYLEEFSQRYKIDELVNKSIKNSTNQI